MTRERRVYQTSRCLGSTGLAMGDLALPHWRSHVWWPCDGQLRQASVDDVSGRVHGRFPLRAHLKVGSLDILFRAEDENVKFFFSRSGFDYDCPLQELLKTLRELSRDEEATNAGWRGLVPAGDSNASDQPAGLFFGVFRWLSRSPSVFGLHPNAEINYFMNSAKARS